jgi:sterol desaturase/sphingolipid hydroxylase (fatty acid hydroxylase superfamily)
MYDAFTQVMAASWVSGTTALSSMAKAALFFFFLGLLVKRTALFTDMRRAATETGLNLKIVVFNLLFVVPVIVVLSQGLHWLIVTQGYALVDTTVWDGLPMLLVIFIGVFVGDFVSYWRHRLEHSRFLWPAHAVHHSDTEMTWLTLERFHPINRLTTFLIDSSALLLLGLPPAALIANMLVRHYYGYLIHADLPWTYGPFGRLFVSPAMHRWHHAADKAAFDTNYATVFSIFDQAFGTYRVPGPCTVPLGVTDDMAPTLAGQIGYAFSPRAYRRSIATPVAAQTEPAE